MIEIHLMEKTHYPEVYEIYDWYVKNSTSTFDWETPERDDFYAHLEEIQEKYPALVVREKGKVEGYAYASAFKDKDAYENVCELTIYLSDQATGKGLGPEVYETLFELLKKQNILKAYACITHPNPASEKFHEKLGFSLCGRFDACGYKFGHPLGMVYMEKILKKPEGLPERFIPWKKIGKLKSTRVQPQSAGADIQKIQAEDHPLSVKEIKS